MDSLYTKDYLKSFLEDLLSKEISKEIIYNFLTFFYSYNEYNDIENNFYIFIILDILNEKIKDDYLFNMIIKSIKLDIISTQLFKEEEIIVKQENKQQIVEQNKNIDPDNYNDLKNYYKNNILNFENSDLDFPEEGKVSIVHYKDNSTFYPRSFIMDFEIDCNGKVLRMVSPPIEIKKKPENSLLYESMVGRILQKNEENKES